MSSDFGSVVAVIPAEALDDPMLGYWFDQAYDWAPRTAAHMGGVLAGPPKIELDPKTGDGFLLWPMVRIDG